AGHAESARWPCPECATELALYDHGEERTWRHLDSCQFQTYLHARPPRVACPEHGVRQVRLPWAEPRARFTTLFERLAIDVQRAQIQAVAMDMWEPYVQSVQTHVPQAERKIVFDVFHILQHMNTAVDKVRRAEHRRLRAQGDDTLTGSKYVWLYGEENVPDHHQERFTELTRRRSRKPLKTARAWSLKESLRDLWRCRSRVAAEEQWRFWYGWATRARLQPVLEVARMI